MPNRRVLVTMVTIVTMAALAFFAIDRAAVPQASVSSAFDHFTTGFALDGAHQFAACESCHVDGQFSGTPLQCDGCHSQGSRVRATFKHARHGLTTDYCEACHLTSAWVPVPRVDHAEALGTCNGCHDGSRAAGKPANHIPASEQCDDCHSTARFSPVMRVDHFQVLGVCSGCHNGTTARGQFAGHIPTVEECDACHNTAAWRP
jgi:hypothetical protein